MFRSFLFTIRSQFPSRFAELQDDPPDDAFLPVQMPDESGQGEKHGKKKKAKKRRNRILDIFRMAHTFTLLVYGFYNPNQKNDMGCYGCNCLKPPKNWRVTEHI